MFSIEAWKFISLREGVMNFILQEIAGRELENNL